MYFFVLLSHSSLLQVDVLSAYSCPFVESLWNNSFSSLKQVRSSPAVSLAGPCPEQIRATLHRSVTFKTSWQNNVFLPCPMEKLNIQYPLIKPTIPETTFDKNIKHV